MRERYPIPTVDEVIQDLNQSKVFSKLDIKLAYHQIELTPESRQITCFMTHKGIFRYKRLMFGINCAPEMYNKVMSQVFQGLEGVRNIFDDVVVYGSTSNEHNDRLDAVLQRLEERGLTLNIDKCKFNMANIEFMGHMLSEHGIGVSQSKVEAIVNSRRPESVSEIRSFLGLVNFVGRFIPNLATAAEPLHRLLHKERKFQWGPEQNDSFEKLKKGLVDASNLIESENSRSQNIVDSLSRLLVVPKNELKQGEINQAEEYIRFVASESTPNAVKIEDVDKMSLNDKELQNIRIVC
ncbi:Hypothetical predicted protein [Mytilus galloprovincialis]|uniref:Reverse transcriptase domain-containing protein n=1 Tax=Mytilus galloprovincialis TaxID=29158 RepID=A0A8B6EF48_MYTGA|nr:Hypothetical predicted protein [Mytilus galloprovincialis]